MRQNVRAACERQWASMGAGTNRSLPNFLGVDRGRWNNIECGAPLSKEMALRIVRKFPGVTLDWLFLGRTEGLTAEMARTLSGPSKGNDAELVAVEEKYGSGRAVAVDQKLRLV